MQIKNSRGVQQEEVWAAADALLANGLRPTIERVRQHLGRGSPNTVSPMLETWFAGLGKRLGMTGEAGRERQMPVAATQALAKLWDAALLVARKEVEAEFAPKLLALADERALLAEEQTRLLELEQAFALRQEMADQMLSAEREKTASAEVRLEAVESTVRQREATIAEHRVALADAQEQLHAARIQNDGLIQRHTEERTKWEERAAGNERRLLGEIERERREAKHARSALTETNALLQSTRSSLEARLESQALRLQTCEVDLGAAHQAVTSMNLRCAELSGLLQEQRMTNGAMLEQLNQTLGALARDSTTSKRRRPAAKVAP